MPLHVYPPEHNGNNNCCYTKCIIVHDLNVKIIVNITITLVILDHAGRAYFQPSAHMHVSHIILNYKDFKNLVWA